MLVGARRSGGFLFYFNFNVFKNRKSTDKEETIKELF